MKKRRRGPRYPHPFFVRAMIPAAAPYLTWAKSLAEARRVAQQIVRRYGCPTGVFESSVIFSASLLPADSGPLVEFDPEFSAVDLTVLLTAQAIATGEQQALPEMVALAEELLAAFHLMREALTQQEDR